LEVIFLVIILVASGLAWTHVARNRISKQLPIVDPQPRRRPFWTIAEFFVCFGLYIICSGAGFSVAQRWMTPATQAKIAAGGTNMGELPTDDMTIVIIANTVAQLAAAVSVLVWMNFVTPPMLSRYGMIPTLADVKLGAWAALLVLPPVFLVSAMLNTLIKYEHPVLDIIGASPTAWSLAVLAITTVLWTPFFEEFTFRVLLQGGAEQVSRRLNLSPSQLAEANEKSGDVVSVEELSLYPWWPVFMCSGTFALLHLGQGAAAVPLFLLAMALGYLYRQTGRLGPSVIVHLILNGITIAIATFSAV